METILFDSDETLFYEISMVYSKSAFNNVQGTGYVTSRRFIFCKFKSRNGLYLLGSIGAVIKPLLNAANKGIDVVIEVNLDNIKSVQTQKYGFGMKYILITRDENQYTLVFNKSETGLFQALQIAIKKATPLVVIKDKGDYVEFQNSKTEHTKADNIEALKSNATNAILNNSSIKGGIKDEELNEKGMQQKGNSESDDIYGKLKEALKDGIITEQEYQKKKGDIVKQEKIKKLNDAFTNGILTKEEYDRKVAEYDDNVEFID